MVHPGPKSSSCEPATQDNRYLLPKPRVRWAWDRQCVQAKGGVLSLESRHPCSCLYPPMHDFLMGVLAIPSSKALSGSLSSGVCFSQARLKAAASLVATVILLIQHVPNDEAQNMAPKTPVAVSPSFLFAFCLGKSSKR